MKFSIYFVPIFILFSISINAQSTDGPYIFYQNDRINSAKVIQVKPTVKDQTKYEVLLHTIKNIHKKKAHSFYVDIDSKESVAPFCVTLQNEFSKEHTDYAEPSKLLAISDLEGNFYAFKKMLICAGVMSHAYKWIFNQGHLVIVGDVFDRGINVTQCFWLIYELERQAQLVGGKVHLIMGNHENMNLRGVEKYVKPKYLNLAEKLNIPFKNLYGSSTELGRWLKTKNAVVKIGNTIYVHGGLSLDLIENNYSLNEINRIARKYYGNPNRRHIEEAALVFDTKRGPLWYRGYFKNDVSNRDVTRILNHNKAEFIVVGHTIQDEINATYKKRIIAIDLKHPKSEIQGKLTMLIKENNQFYVLDEDGLKNTL